MHNSPKRQDWQGSMGLSNNMGLQFAQRPFCTGTLYESHLPKSYTIHQRYYTLIRACVERHNTFVAQTEKKQSIMRGWRHLSS